MNRIALALRVAWPWIAFLSLVALVASSPLAASDRRDGSLDVVLGELPPDDGSEPGRPARGALVLEVESGGAGDLKGLREGDIIVQFENEPVHSAWELAGLIRREGEGSLVSIWVWRHGDRKWLGLARLSGRVPPQSVIGEVAALRSEVAALRHEVAALREAVESLP